ncbi:MAG: cation:proton antiporter [Methanocellales archaeon]|nr:cation:proton antiporter [Methanocellales archaeon]
MHILLQILLLLLLAKAFGEFFERMGFPSVLGEISAGLLLVSVFLISPEDEILKFLAGLGVIFFLFTAGYKETNLRELRATFKQSFLPATFGVTIPFIFGFLLGKMFNFASLDCLFIGVALTPTSIGMTVRTLIDLDYLSTKVGSILLNASVLDDIVCLFLLAVVIQISLYHELSVGQLLTMGGKLVAFVLIMIILGLHVLPKLFEYIQKMHVEEAIFTGVIAVALFSAFLAEKFGLHAVIGAFIGGIILSTIPIAKIQDVQDKVSGFSYGIFVPIFFAFIGLSVDLSALSTAGLFAALLIILALAGKVIGGFIGSKLVGLDSYDSLIYGVGSMPRVGVELAVIAIAQSMGIIGPEVFSAIVLMVAVSVIVTPIALKCAVELKRSAS